MIVLMDFDSILDNVFLRHGLAQYGHRQHFGHLIIIQLNTEAKQPLTIKMSLFQFLSASFKCKYYLFVIFLHKLTQTFTKKVAI